MALRTTGHLLLGIVRIYSRKAKYLLADCNEAFFKIKMAFRPGQIEIEDDGQLATNAAINLPEASVTLRFYSWVYQDFDAALPDFNDLDMQTQIQMNQSRIDDITLKEDLIPEAGDMTFGSEFGTDDFGENTLGFFNDNLEERREDELDTPNELKSRTSVLEESHPLAEKHDDINGKPMDIDLADHLGIPEPDDDFGDFPTDNMLDDVIFNENELAKSLDAMEAPRAEQDIPMETDDVAAATAAFADLVQPTPTASTLGSESFALEPLDVAAVAGIEKPGRPKRKRRLVVDEQKNISGDEMKGNMADFRDTVQPLDLAPPTRKLMKLKETGIADKLFVNPGCPHLRAFSLLKVISPVDNLAHLETIPEEEIPAVPEEIQISNKEKDLFAGPEKKKERKSRAERTLEEDETAIDGEDEHRWTKRTQNVLNSISAKIKASADGKVKFFLLTENSHLCFLCVFAVQRCYNVAIVSKSAYCREVVCMCVFRSEQTLSPTFISATRKSGRLKFWICIPTRVSPPVVRFSPTRS
ncbi:unnamed protein product [Gongylonema pulchrum]|uniref:Rad21_Rec8_N domain-containing protein n=1 Tax=Gongylonema pulchrum TaxID=637853 RepID=A0A183E6H1_9BILA|nr:unnamed protein product [Gongylonema pulchrum]